MRNRTQRGGIFSALLVGILMVIIGAIALALVIASNVKVRHLDTANGARVSIETPVGDMNIDARDNLRPETVGIPVYPGAVREHRDGGGVMVDINGSEGGRHQLSFVTASYSTTDSADQVREFYRTRLPNWMFTQKRGNKLKIEYSEGGYKRIVAIDERHGRTHIGIASTGDPGVN